MSRTRASGIYPSFLHLLSRDGGRKEGRSEPSLADRSRWVKSIPRAAATLSGDSAYVDQVLRLLTRAKPRCIQLHGGSSPISPAILPAIPAPHWCLVATSPPAKLRLNKSWRRFPYTDAMLYESMVPVLRRSPGSVCAVADTRQLPTDVWLPVATCIREARTPHRWLRLPGPFSGALHSGLLFV
jgi:hypothetical protein